jgi:hypothetical protein
MDSQLLLNKRVFDNGSASSEIVDVFLGGIYRWTILLAQMQSGKTNTYLHVAYQLLKSNVVEHVVIFSGTADIDLKHQLTTNVYNAEKSSFWNNIVEKEPDVHLFMNDIMNKIHVVWGSDLDTYIGPNENTLFIWEEAHYAQNTSNRPYRFLKKRMIAPNGDEEPLLNKNNYVLSVSATPFSELSDFIHMKQQKYVVKMQPFPGYVGVEQIIRSGRLVPFENIHQGVRSALNLPHESPKWGVIRVSKRNDEMVKQLVSCCGWKFVVYDTVVEKYESPEQIKKKRAAGEKAWKSMNKPPVEDTVILIRGTCRMGKNMHKNHLLFVMETSRFSNTDVVLQGLLGRTCGYSKGSEKVMVYLPKPIVESGEIERYVEMWSNDDVQHMPLKANNLSEESVSHHKPIVPVKLVRLEGYTAPSLRNNRKHILDEISHILLNEPLNVHNKNSLEDFKQVQQKFFEALKENKKYIHIRYMKPDSATTVTRGKEQLDKLIKAFDNASTSSIGTGCGHGTDNKQVNIWVTKNNASGFDVNSVYITCNLECNPDNDLRHIPTTTKREAFAHSLEDGSTLIGNGGFVIPLSVETATSVDAMCEELIDLISISQKRYMSKGIVSSSWDINDCEFKGIQVNEQVLNALEKGGSIFNKVKFEYGVIIKVCKTRGRPDSYMAISGFKRLASISWDN